MSMTSSSAEASESAQEPRAGSSVAISRVLPILHIGSPEQYPLMNIQSFIESYKSIPTPVELSRGLRESGWILRADWQTNSEIYRVVNDLFTKQRFVELIIVYLSNLQLTIVCGKEPAGNNPGNFNVETEASPTFDGAGMFVIFISGNFTSAVITGAMRLQLEDELGKLKNPLEQYCGSFVRPGWTLAITDCDQVCYYVERMLSIEQLTENSYQTREEELSGFFGKNRAYNTRRAEPRRSAFQQPKEVSETGKIASEDGTELQEAGDTDDENFSDYDECFAEEEEYVD